MCSDIPWTREIEKVVGWDGYAYAPCWLHPEDAEPRGIKGGDIVRVFNDRGGVLGGAVVTEGVRPGVVKFEKAGGSHHIIPGELDQGGNTDSISTKWNMAKTCYGLSTINYLVEVEKVTGNKMDEWRENYPEAFKRNREAYGPERGPHFAGWVEGAK
jgi:trimethylamine-N-oxide reductase (cytochrome c)